MLMILFVSSLMRLFIDAEPSFKSRLPIISTKVPIVISTRFSLPSVSFFTTNLGVVMVGSRRSTMQGILCTYDTIAVSMHQESDNLLLFNFFKSYTPCCYSLHNFIPYLASVLVQNDYQLMTIFYKIGSHSSAKKWNIDRKTNSSPNCSSLYDSELTVQRSTFSANSRLRLLGFKSNR